MDRRKDRVEKCMQERNGETGMMITKSLREQDQLKGDKQ